MGKKGKHPAVTETKTIKAPQPKIISKGWIRVILVVVVLILYGNSINYEFTVDDNLFYLKHASVQKGLSGIGETFTHGSLEKYNGMTGVQPYRPVTLVSFAVQKQLFNNDPAKSHLVNVILYVLLVLILFNLLLKLFPAAHPMLNAIIVLLFAVHPVHTEVVASVKSQDELLSALFAFLALSYAASLVKADKYSLKYSLLSFACFGLALLSKEGAFAMILIFPLVFWMLLSQSIKRSIIYSLPYIGIALIFLFVRDSVLSSGQAQNYQNTVLENVLYGAGSFAEASATKMEILFHYLRLLFIPWPLSWDYSYNEIPLVNWSSVLAWVSVLLYAGMLAFAIFKFKKKSVISFGILFYLIMLVPTSNLFFLIGATLSERFLFLPSLGFIIAVVFGLAAILKLNITSFSGQRKSKFLAISVVVIIVFAGMTVSRSSDWRSNLSVFESGVKNAPNSSRTNAALGNRYRIMGEKEQFLQQRTDYYNDAIKYSKRSLAIYPLNKDALYNLGVTYQKLLDFPNAIAAYQNMLTYFPEYRSAINNLGVVYMGSNKFDSAYVYFKRCYYTDTAFAKSSQNLAIYYFKIGNFDQAVQFAKNAIRLNRNMKISYEVIMQVYKNSGNTAEAAKYLKLYNEMLVDFSDTAEDNEPKE